MVIVVRNLIVNPQQIALLQQSRLGVEVEEHRINNSGHLSQVPHPTDLGSRRFHPYFQSDFAESQAEIITDPHTSMTALSRQLATLQAIFAHALQPNELIWPLSLPPEVSSADLTFIANNFERPAYQDYRDYLLEKYGIQHAITTGSHVSFSLPTALLTGQSVAARNQLYFHIVQNFMLARWILTYLFGATPQAAPNYFSTFPTALAQPVRSIRNSEYGFTNTTSENVRYTSLASYLHDIDAAIATGQLYSQHEFYGPVRLKKQSKLNDLLTEGIDYLEFRVFDLDPFSADAISQTTLRFFKVFISYLAVRPLPDDLAAALAHAQQRNRQVALEAPERPSAFTNELQAWLQQLTDFSHSWPTDYRQAVTTIAQRASQPELTPSARIMYAASQQSLTAFALAQATLHRQQQQQQIPPEAAPLNADQQQLLIAAYQLGLRVKHSNTTIQLCGQHSAVELTEIQLNGTKATTKLQQLFPELL